MDSDNWVVQNLENALDTWNSKMAEVWSLLTMSPQSFKGGGIWQVILQINGAVKGIGLALLVLFFLVGVVKTSGSLTEVKRPEHALKLFRVKAGYSCPDHHVRHHAPGLLEGVEAVIACEDIPKAVDSIEPPCGEGACV